MWKGCIFVFGVLPTAMSGSPWSLIQSRTLVEGNLGTVSSLDEALTLVQSLAEKVVGHDVPLTQAEQSAVETVKKYVKRMLADIIQQRNEDQAEVKRNRAVVGNCAKTAKESLEGAVTNLRTEADNARKRHDACRKGEVSEATETSTKCSEYDAYRSSPPGSSPPKCMETLSSSDVTTTDPATKKSMEQCITAIHAWVVPLYDLYIKCKQRRDIHVGKTRQCDGKQAEFESDFCQYSTLLTGTCEGQDACREKNIKLLKAGDQEVKVAEAARETDCIVGHKVDCLLKIFEETDNEKKPKMLEECKKLVPTCPEKIEFPAIPGATSCSGEPNQPCDEKWLEKEYTSQSWYAQAPTTSCHACLPPHPCKVTIYQHAHFEGWSASFPPGEWNTRELKRRGAKDDQVSAVEVEEGCLAVVYANPDLTGRSGVFAVGKHDFAEFKQVFPNDLVSSLLVLRQISFQLKGRYGEEEVEIRVGSETKRLTLPTYWVEYEFDVPSDGKYTINFLNDGGRWTNVNGVTENRDVFFKSDYHSTITLPGRFPGWKCGTAAPDVACQAVQDGVFKWQGPYEITLG